MSDLHQYVRRQLMSRSPVDDREAASIERFLELFDTLSAPFSEDTDPVHVTASGIVIGSRGVILLKHRRLGIWLQPGGHIDPGESPWDAALRETREETGLDVRLADGASGDAPPSVVHVDVHPGPKGHTHLDLRYLIDGVDDDPDPPEGESQEVHWFGWEAAIERADPGLSGALRALRPTT